MNVRFKLLVTAILILLTSPALQAQQKPDCLFAQKRFDLVWALTDTAIPELANMGGGIKQNWGIPKSETKNKPYNGATLLVYEYDACTVESTLNEAGRVATKKFTISGPIAPDLDLEKSKQLQATEASLQKSISDLESQIFRLQDQLFDLQNSLSGVQSQLRGKPALGLTSTPPTTTIGPNGRICAENGSCYGDISDDTGKPKTVEVKGYYRKDGTYVKGHYRSK